MIVLLLLAMFMCSEKEGALAMQECGFVVNNTLISPGYPNNYPNNLDCNYSVSIPHGMAMKIYFHELNVEYHPTCAYDYLKITNENGETFGVICGSRYGTDIIVTGDYARLKFHSDYETQKRGFNISFIAVPKPKIIECGSVVNNTLTSPSYPDNYPNNMDCNYSVPIPHGLAIKINFHEFDVEYDLKCMYDYLKITNENDEIFGVVCGEQPGENVVVIGNYVQLTFHSDSDVQKKGFLISFTAVPRSEIRKCGSVVNNTLKSPGYPGNYPSNMDCNYSVPIPPRMAIKITFYEMLVESHSSCQYDYLKITNDKNETFGMLCGLRRATFIVVTGNYVRLTFHSDSDIAGRGYFISFTVVPNHEIIGCGSIVNNTLTSPGYPNNYPPNMDCNYSVPIPHGMSLKISFHEFNVQYESQCGYDYLDITNEKGKSFDIYCGGPYKKDFTVDVNGNYARLRFHSDADLQRKGFLLYFSSFPLAECGSVINNTLTSPGYPNEYPNNMDCSFYVPIQPGMAVNVNFRDFHVEYDSSKPTFCPNDYLMITNDKGDKFGTYCGTKSGTEVFVTGQYALLTFYSNPAFQARGFLISFTFVDCGPRCSFKWDGDEYKLACWNVISILAVVKCFPRIVSTLEVSSSHLSILPVGVFSNLTGLRTLDLSSNNIEILPADVVSSLKQLETLYVS